MATDDVLMLMPSLRCATFSKNIVIDSETMEVCSVLELSVTCFLPTHTHLPEQTTIRSM